ncbi:DUF4145 domain-containing protein [Actibacterium pelagium]|uniref:DUF4145 domain-containing protein n=1 Tax=Actibacterium pelagium TaxID=2029103 RepID=A0A917AGG3_9RHOB|nr:DUF4145 domain-containing protein [Actibacterium pelagium]GGE46772.1 hypothetical protein GCM10011517_13140 [Actibacterium pelagium]
MKYVSPSVKETAFNCPYCGALAKQFWYCLLAQPIREDHPLPHIYTLKENENWNADQIGDPEVKKSVQEWIEKMADGLPFFEKLNESRSSRIYLNNVNISKCYNCSQLSLWLHDRLVFPEMGEAPPANPDMPKCVLRDYNEASRILNLSPRGAAALIRLAIDKLCGELANPKKPINENIKTLVANGLDSRVQKALDAVRVIGNNAVHPGQINLDDDRTTAESLFRLLNVIVEKMISEPKHIDEVYAMLPEGALNAIEKRDKKPEDS